MAQSFIVCCVLCAVKYLQILFYFLFGVPHTQLTEYNPQKSPKPALNGYSGAMDETRRCESFGLSTLSTVISCCIEFAGGKMPSIVTDDTSVHVQNRLISTLLFDSSLKIGVETIF